MQTLHYIIKRIILAAVSLFIIITLTFFLMNLMPGDPFMSEKASEENRAILIAKYGLDQPVYIQYGRYLKSLLHGDMGTSYVLQKGRQVTTIISDSFKVSMRLGLKALAAALIIGVTFGCVAGLHKDSLLDNVIRVITSVGISMPGYVIASLIMIVFAVCLDWLPVTYNKPGGSIMPVITLAMYPTSYMARLTRASILEVMNQDYLLTERAKGMSEFVVVFVHALKNSLIPVITYLAPLTATILTGGFVAESVFNVPGLGRYMVSSISMRDYTMIMGVTIFYSALIILMNLVCDILYKVVDTRITLE
ncbi:MAG: ABC transporter permease [Blautia sp.]|nr:ABC transporter permease [Blautia sp.]